jgi:hypothetical protein
MIYCPVIANVIRTETAGTSWNALMVWFLAAYLNTSQTLGMSAMQLQRQLGDGIVCMQA